MKIIRYSITLTQLEDQQIPRLTNEIRQIETAIWGTDEHILRTLSHVKKENLLATLEVELARHTEAKKENIIKALYPTQELRNALNSPEHSQEKKAIYSAIATESSIPQIQALRDHHQWMRDRTFPAFSHLPSELRLQIWEEIWGRIPRIHTIKENDSRFVSNQPSSILLSTCQESRAYYLQSTNHTFAFNSYINFHIDTIYLRGTEQATSSNLILKFLASPDTHKCEKFAVEKDLLVQNFGRPECFRKLIEKMQNEMPRWTELDIVADDVRIMEEALRDKNARFVRASGKFIKTSHVVRLSFLYIKDSVPLQFTYRIVKVDPALPS